MAPVSMEHPEASWPTLSDAITTTQPKGKRSYMPGAPKRGASAAPSPIGDEKTNQCSVAILAQAILAFYGLSREWRPGCDACIGLPPVMAPVALSL